MHAPLQAVSELFPAVDRDKMQHWSAPAIQCAAAAVRAGRRMSSGPATQTIDARWSAQVAPRAYSRDDRKPIRTVVKKK
jgi:CelD/BcsL family acetyltransferase involved in cellulose biosynthesis